MKKFDLILVCFLFCVFALGGVMLCKIIDFDMKINDQPVVDSVSHPVLVVDTVSWFLAVNHLVSVEGFSPMPYIENNSLYVGHGHKILPADSFSYPISESDARSIAEHDLMLNVVFVANKYNLYGNQALAVGLMAYNRGVGNTCADCMHDFLSDFSNNPDLFFSSQWRSGLSLCWLSKDLFMGKPHNLLSIRRNYELNLFFSI